MQEASPAACLAAVLGPANVVSLDAANHRAFVVYEGDAAQSDSTIISRLRRMAGCFPETSSWHEDWSASFFSEHKFADYKDAEAVRPFVITGEWAQAYLAEYNHADHQVIFDPVTAPRRVRLDD